MPTTTSGEVQHVRLSAAAMLNFRYKGYARHSMLPLLLFTFRISKFTKLDNDRANLRRFWWLLSSSPAGWWTDRLAPLRPRSDGRSASGMWSSAAWKDNLSESRFECETRPDCTAKWSAITHVHEIYVICWWHWFTGRLLCGYKRCGIYVLSMDINGTLRLIHPKVNYSL